MTSDVRLRTVEDGDLPVFFAHQLEPEATRMAAFPSREHAAFLAHWAKILAAPETNLSRTVVFRGQVAGYIGSWQQAGERQVGYWLGREFWGRGIASAALTIFLGEVAMRPLHAHVVKHNVASIRVLQKCGFVISGEEKFPAAAGGGEEEIILTLGASER